MEKKAIRVAYGEAIVKLGAENDKVVVLDADLAAATMTNGFKKAYPDRFIDCGIAEANMVDMAADVHDGADSVLLHVRGVCGPQLRPDSQWRVLSEI